jgi:hypothetical protein
MHPEDGRGESPQEQKGILQGYDLREPLHSLLGIRSWHRDGARARSLRRLLLSRCHPPAEILVLGPP